MDLLLTVGASLTIVETTKGMYPLHMAVCVHRNSRLVDCILRHSCLSSSLLSGKGRSSLHYAIRSTNRREIRETAKIVQMLLPHTDPNVLVSQDLNPLIEAIEQGHLAVVEILVQAGAPIGLITNNKESTVWHAIKNNREKILELLVSSLPPSDLSSLLQLVPDCGLTCLFVAAAGGNVNILKTVLSKISPSEIDVACKIFYKPFHAKTSMTPLWKTVAEGHYEATKVLLEHKANPCLAETSNLRTCLHTAAWAGRADLVALLLEYGADPMAVEKDQGTALSDAIYRGHLPAARLLLAHESHMINIPDKTTCSPSIMLLVEAMPKELDYCWVNLESISFSPLVMESRLNSHKESSRQIQAFWK